MTNHKDVLIDVRDVKKHFKIDRKHTLKAVDGLTFQIYKGETFGLVGESGCGKSTAGRTIMRLYEATGGAVYYRGKNIQGKLKNVNSVR